MQAAFQEKDYTGNHIDDGCDLNQGLCDRRRNPEQDEASVMDMCGSWSQDKEGNAPQYCQSFATLRMSANRAIVQRNHLVILLKHLRVGRVFLEFCWRFSILNERGTSCK